jgi:N-acetylglucosamine kinase-like BadF-type ATPase
MASLPRLLLAVDGGGSKTEVMLLDRRGRVLADARGVSSSPQLVGLGMAIEVVAELIHEVRAAAGLRPAQQIEHAALCLAGIDLPSEERAARRAIARTGWARTSSVVNDTFAVLRSGTNAGWGVAVVVGSGTNCVGISPDGRVLRYLALGPSTGDWGGGFEIGHLALHHAARAQDGRGPSTMLRSMVAAHFGMRQPLDVSLALHRDSLTRVRLAELVPVVMRAADLGDPIALSLLMRQADEVVTTATTTLRRLRLLGEAVPVVLGGGVMAARHVALLEPITLGLRAAAPRSQIVVATVAPVVGAALLALDATDAAEPAKRRLLTTATAGTRTATATAGARLPSAE